MSRNEKLVKDVMTEDVVAVLPTDNLARVYDLMASGDFRHLPVVDGSGDLVGLVTHRDLMASALGPVSDLPISERQASLKTMSVERVMSSGIEAIDPDTDLREAAEIMIENKYGCLPVVENRRLVGILTESDFVKLAI